MYFSPKTPGSLVATFCAVLIVTMLREGYEDLMKAKADREMNERDSLVWDQKSCKFEQRKWQDIKVGDIVRVLKD